MSTFLKQFKTSRYFPTKVSGRWDGLPEHENVNDVNPRLTFQVRSTISDFAVFLTIVVMVLLDFVIGVPSQKLKVPSKFQVWR